MRNLNRTFNTILSLCATVNFLSASEDDNQFASKSCSAGLHDDTHTHTKQIAMVADECFNLEDIDFKVSLIDYTVADCFLYLGICVRWYSNGDCSNTPVHVQCIWNVNNNKFKFTYTGDAKIRSIWMY